MSEFRREELELVVFDMDGVLIDSSPCHERAFARLWESCGVSGPSYDAIAGRSTREVVREITAALDPSAADLDRWTRQKQRWAHEFLSNGDHSFEDARPILEALRVGGVRTALATSATRERTELALPALGGASAFCAIFTADDVEQSKPDPEVYRRAIEHSQARPHNSLVVEDSSSGVAAGLAAGAWVATVRSELQIDEPACVGRFADLRELATWLRVDAA